MYKYSKKRLVIFASIIFLILILALNFEIIKETYTKIVYTNEKYNELTFKEYQKEIGFSLTHGLLSINGRENSNLRASFSDTEFLNYLYNDIKFMNNSYNEIETINIIGTYPEDNWIHIKLTYVESLDNIQKLNAAFNFKRDLKNKWYTKNLEFEDYEGTT